MILCFPACTKMAARKQYWLSFASGRSKTGGLETGKIERLTVHT